MIYSERAYGMLSLLFLIKYTEAQLWITMTSFRLFQVHNDVLCHRLRDYALYVSTGACVNNIAYQNQMRGFLLG